MNICTDGKLGNIDAFRRGSNVTEVVSVASCCVAERCVPTLYARLIIGVTFLIITDAVFSVISRRLRGVVESIAPGGDGERRPTSRPLSTSVDYNDVLARTSTG